MVILNFIVLIVAGLVLIKIGWTDGLGACLGGFFPLKGLILVFLGAWVLVHVGSSFAVTIAQVML